MEGPGGEKKLTSMSSPDFLRAAAGMQSCACGRSNKRGWLPPAASWASWVLRRQSRREPVGPPTSPSVTKMLWPPLESTGSGYGWCERHEKCEVVRRSRKMRNKMGPEMEMGTSKGRVEVEGASIRHHHLHALPGIQARRRTLRTGEDQRGPGTGRGLCMVGAWLLHIHPA